MRAIYTCNSKRPPFDFFDRGLNVLNPLEISFPNKFPNTILCKLGCEDRNIAFCHCDFIIAGQGFIRGIAAIFCA